MHGIITGLGFGSVGQRIRRLSPRSIPGMTLGFEPILNSGLYSDAALTTPITTNGTVKSVQPYTGPSFHEVSGIACPSLVTNGSNTGRPVLRFPGILRSTVNFAVSAAFTVAFLGRLDVVDAASVIFQVGSNTSGFAIKIAATGFFQAVKHGGTGGSYIQSTQKAKAGDWFFVVFDYDGVSTGRVHFHGITDTPKSQAPLAIADGLAIIGGRTTTTEVADMDLGGLWFFDHVLTDAHRNLLETYALALSQYPWRPMWTASPSLGGLANNKGMMPSDPFNSVQKVVSELNQAGGGTGICRFPEDAPDTVECVLAYDTRINVEGSSLSGGQFFMDGGTSYLSGWTHAGNGIWSQTTHTTVESVVAVNPTFAHERVIDGVTYTVLRWFKEHLDTDGTHLVIDASTPDYRFDHRSGTTTIKLPAGVDPNASGNNMQLKLGLNTTCFTQKNSLPGYVKGLVASHANRAAIRVGQSPLAGNCLFINCVARYSANGFQTLSGPKSIMQMDRCLSYGHANDCLNGHGTDYILTEIWAWNCINFDCGDEPWSIHDHTVGKFFYCVGDFGGSGGFTHVNFSNSYHVGCKARNNGLISPDATWGGFNTRNFATGVYIDCDASNNIGPGFYRSGEAVMTVTNRTSAGNSVADNV